PTGWSWQLTFPDGGQPTATLLDRRGRAAGTGLVREPEMLALIRAIDDAFPVPHLPRHARAVSLAGTHLTSISDTTLAPRALLALLGPTVREIRERSRMPGELTLKRDIADNRREELYISRTNLTARYADLPAEHRILLDDAGFGRGLTTHLAELSQPELPSRPSPPPVAARASSPTIPARPSPSSRSPSTSMHTVQIPTLSMPAAEKPRRREADRPLRSILTVQPLPKPLALPIANRRILTPTG
ncbi:MAG TPA: hypothetical protein VN253_27395, partial [Kofleriaceae bacterium]|nr:hypothetical protein [Kofleriaceae bacterium]